MRPTKTRHDTRAQHRPRGGSTRAPYLPVGTRWVPIWGLGALPPPMPGNRNCMVGLKAEANPKKATRTRRVRDSISKSGCVKVSCLGIIFCYMFRCLLGP
eukprot:1647341-Rhodomonas_salina.1